MATRRHDNGSSAMEPPKRPLQRQTGRSCLVARDVNVQAPAHNTVQLKKPTAATASQAPLKVTIGGKQEPQKMAKVGASGSSATISGRQQPSVFDRLYKPTLKLRKETTSTSAASTTTLISRTSQHQQKQRPLVNPPIASFEVYEDETPSTSAVSEVRAGFSAALHVDSAKQNQHDSGFFSQKTEVAEEEEQQLQNKKTSHEEDAVSVYGSAVEEAPSEYLSAVADKEDEDEGSWMGAHADYAQDIWKYMVDREQRGLKIRPGFMEKQADLHAEMRSILIDWMVDVTTEYGLDLETFHLAVSIVDRVLVVNDVPRAKLQLVGSTAMFIAAKFEEIFPPELREFVYITDEMYTEAQLLRMERVILGSLQFKVRLPSGWHEFQIGVPTCVWFARRLLDAETREGGDHVAAVKTQTRHYTHYVLELASIDANFSPHRPSRIAAAAVCLANTVSGLAPWPESLESLSGIGLEEVTELVPDLITLLSAAASARHHAVYDKYASTKLASVALLPVPDLPRMSQV